MKKQTLLLVAVFTMSLLMLSCNTNEKPYDLSAGYPCLDQTLTEPIAKHKDFIDKCKKPENKDCNGCITHKNNGKTGRPFV